MLTDHAVLARVAPIWSATLKEQRRVLIYTPPSYSDTTDTPRRYPVLYCWMATHTSIP